MVGLSRFSLSCSDRLLPSGILRNAFDPRRSLEQPAHALEHAHHLRAHIIEAGAKIVHEVDGLFP